MASEAASKYGAMSKRSDCQPKNDRAFHCDECPQGLMQVCPSTLPRPRTDQLCTMRPVLKKLPGKRRNWSTVPLAVGVLAKVTQGLTMMSSSQFLTTKPPGPKAMLGSRARVGVV